MPTPTRLADVTPFTIGDASFFPHSSPARGGTELAVWQLRVGPATNGGGAGHVIDREEVFVVVSGELLITVDGEQVRLGPGDALAVPGGSRLIAAGGADGAVVTVCTRAGLRATMDGGSVLAPPWAS